MSSENGVFTQQPMGIVSRSGGNTNEDQTTFAQQYEIVFLVGYKFFTTEFLLNWLILHLKAANGPNEEFAQQALMPEIIV